MQLSVIMDPSHPRRETSERRTRRSATIWKIIAGVVGVSALTAVVVASCLDRDVARRDLEEPAYVETTSSTATHDSTGGVATPGGACGTTTVTSATATAGVGSEAGPNAGHASHANNDPNNR